MVSRYGREFSLLSSKSVPLGESLFSLRVHPPRQLTDRPRATGPPNGALFPPCFPVFSRFDPTGRGQRVGRSLLQNPPVASGPRTQRFETLQVSSGSLQLRCRVCRSFVYRVTEDRS